MGFWGEIGRVWLCDYLERRSVLQSATEWVRLWVGFLGQTAAYRFGKHQSQCCLTPQKCEPTPSPSPCSFVHTHTAKMRDRTRVLLESLFVRESVPLWMHLGFMTSIAFFFGTARLRWTPNNTCCSEKARVSCASYLLLWSWRRILGAPIFQVHKHWLWRGWTGEDGLGAALWSLVTTVVSPQYCPTPSASPISAETHWLFIMNR